MKVDEAGLRIRPWGLRTNLSVLDASADDLVFMIRRAAYVGEIRALGLRVRRAGLTVELLGVLAFVWAALRGPGMHSRIAHTAEAAIVLGWLLLAYVMIRRTRYVRAHPFDPNV